ncbi:MAG: type II toxin-antitoxin system HicA family toxin [Nitrospirales bacterium]|nr:type II toxin-antitoxin system HicA family toxin [Nitrospirales bacterium]
MKALKKNGWVQVAKKGSHSQFAHPNKKSRITHPKCHIPIGTLKSIEKQSGLVLR